MANHEPTTNPVPGPTRTGYVAILGRPNAGKSTLMNRLLGEHLSIVTPRAQTTWQRVTGILTIGASQLVLLDTPGLLEARNLMQRAMLGAALEALHEADVLLLVVDASRPPVAGTTASLEQTLGEAGAPVHLALNKRDTSAADTLDAWAVWGTAVGAASTHRISALTGEGVEPLLEALLASLPEGPFLYPEDEIASEPVRFFVAELVRETVFEQYEQEIPYSVFARVEEFREDEDPVYILVHLYVERASQKGIVIGAGGRAIRSLGEAARVRIEHFLGRRVYLDLWVKPSRSWRKDRARLGEWGFRVPEDDEARRT
jgi:GTPase